MHFGGVLLLLLLQDVDVVPVTSVWRIVALVYMFFGITLIATVMAVITNTFYRKRIVKDEELKEKEVKYLRASLFEKLQDIEKNQLECLEQ